MFYDQAQHKKGKLKYMWLLFLYVFGLETEGKGGSLLVSNKVCDKATVNILSAPCEEKQFQLLRF